MTIIRSAQQIMKVMDLEDSPRRTSISPDSNPIRPGAIR
jgi:hypothetical protein